MNEHLNKKLLELQKSVRALAKNEQGYGYDYVSGSKLLYFVRPKMDELGLRLVPNTISVEQQIVETAPEGVNKDGSPKPAKYEVLVLLHKSFTWIDVETGESETTDFFSQGCNGWDKAIGSAETYAERYFLLKYFHIATDEDDVDALAPKVQDAPAPDKKKTTRTKKEEQPVQETPVEVKPAETALAAITAAEKAKSEEELRAVWAANKDMYGNNPNFKLAISTNPHNPKKR